MGAKMQSFNSYKNLTEPIYKVPKSVQQTIPISKISKSGIFEIENKAAGLDRIYDKAYLFWDVNYKSKDEFKREEFLKLYCKVLNAMNVSFKIEILNLNRDMQKLDDEIYLKQNESALADYTTIVDDFNKVMRDKIELGSSGIEQVKVFIISCKRQNYYNAKAFFNTVEQGLKTNFKKMESGLIPLDATQRLHFLHRIYRLGHEGDFNFDWESAIKLKRDWRSDICNTGIKEHKDYLEFDDYVAKVLFAKTFPNSWSDDFITELTAVPFNSITTIDCAPIPKPVAQKKLLDMYNSNGRAIERQQAQRNKAGAFSSEVSYAKQQEREEIKGYMDIMRSGDENMFFCGLYVLVIAKDVEEVNSNSMTIEGIGSSHNVLFESHTWNQLNAFNTCLPVAARQVSTMRTVFTQPLAALIPFNVQEVCEAGGIFYGINQVSKNPIVGNRKKLVNGNGFILGVPGSGKSVDAKTEMLQVVINTNDDVIAIDPQKEYVELAHELGGEYIDVSAKTENYINPLDTDTLATSESEKHFISDKSQLMQSICEQILEYSLTAKQKSIIDRCIIKVYSDFLAEEKETKLPPTITELSALLKEVDNTDAKDLVVALEMFVDGSLNNFSKQTNINTKNRFTVYGTRDLGKALAPVGQLIMLESIRTRIAQNAKKGIATWLYIDEFHNLVKGESAEYLEKIWKEVRKLGGLCTGITQNVIDLLVSKTVETMLSNSEFVCLLRQGEPDREELERVRRLNENELAYVQNSDFGHGLLQFGDKRIAFDNRLPKESVIYKLVNTNFHEIQEEKRKESKRKVTKRLKKVIGKWHDDKRLEAQEEEDATIPEENKLSYETIS
jgi:Type IV secretory pathway, VirB4 components